MYDNGTNDDWIDGRVAITTDEWNSFSTTPLSFKVRVEVNEGIWVEPVNECTFDVSTINVATYDINKDKCLELLGDPLDPFSMQYAVVKV